MTELVLCYHAVSESWDHRLSLTPTRLLAQVRMLRRLAPVHVTFDDAFSSILTVLPTLQDAGVPVTVFVCSGFADHGAPLLIPELATDDRRELAGLRTLSWPELRELAESGVALGSHTVSHAHLTTLDDDRLTAELRESKRRIEEEVGRSCPLLAYPYGEHDERVRNAARAAGYECAYGLRVPHGDRFALPRVDLYRRHTPLRAALSAAPFLSPAVARICRKKP